MQPIKLTLATCLLLQLVYSQDLYEGSFMTNDQLYGLQFKKVSNGFHGVLVSYQGTFALKGIRTKSGISGEIYAEGSITKFSGVPIEGGWKISSYGVDYFYYQLSTKHELDGVDLTPFFTTEPINMLAEEQVTPPTYEQTTKKQGSESGDIYSYVAGSQLVYYTRTSYVSSSSASTIVYINFCANGQFTLNYDGGFSVEGNYGGNAQGASRGTNSGTWKIVKQPNTNPAITLYYNNGEMGSIYVTKNKLSAGRWKVANTQYALVRNKVNCH